MEFSKKCLIIVAGISIVKTDSQDEHYRTFFHPPKPWFIDDFSHYTAEPSETISHYAYAYPYDSIGHGSSYYPTYTHYSHPSTSDSFYSSTKKIPKENKTFKKPTSPFYPTTDHDSVKLKEFILKSGSPYCQEIKSEKAKNEGKSSAEAMTCYKCKDPKRGSTYEECFYTSNPEGSDKRGDEHGQTRFRRSNKKLDNDRAGSVPAAYLNSEQKELKVKQPHGFSKEYFLPEASRKFSIEHKTEDSCQKVYKNSMVCLVCKNLKSGGKSEQCSHINDPKDKSYAYSKSQSFGKPRNEKLSISNGEPAPIHEIAEPNEYKRVDRLVAKPTQAVKDATKDSECRQVKKDSEICTVCKDPKTGGNSQRCTYSYEPDEKIYKFSRSKSFGYPESVKEEARKPSADKEVSESDPEESTVYSDDESGENYSSYDNPEAESNYESLESPSSESEESKESQNYDYEPNHSEYIKSESEKILKNAESDNCKKVQKDSMICSICKDPNTGEDSESCTYSYEPNDKKFSYTKSKSFGSPTNTGDDSEEYSVDGSTYGSSESSGEGSHAYASEIKPTVSYPRRRQQVAADSKAQEMVFLGNTDQKPVSKVDIDILGTSKRQAEMEKLLEDTRAENKTKCKKVMKNEMTCYKCVDDAGFRQEECMFITNPKNSSKSLNNSFRESAKLKLDAEPKPVASTDILKIKKKKKRPTKTEATTILPLEPSASSSGHSYRLKRQPKKKYKDNKSSETNNSNEYGHDYGGYSPQENKKQDQSPYETDPHEYVAETQYKYDKVLGVKLPAHMLEISDYEKEFDDIFYANFNDEE